MDSNQRELLTRTIAQVVNTHRVVDERFGGGPASCDVCMCGWTRESVVDPGTYRWHVATHIVDALEISEYDNLGHDDTMPLPMLFRLDILDP